MDCRVHGSLPQTWELKWCLSLLFRSSAALTRKAIGKGLECGRAAARPPLLRLSGVSYIAQSASVKQRSGCIVLQFEIKGGSMYLRKPGSVCEVLDESKLEVRFGDMGRQAAAVLYVLAMTGVIVVVDFVFFRNRSWERLTVNIGIVLVFAAFYFRFLRHS